MQRKIQSETRSIEGVRLTLDDYRELVAILRQNERATPAVEADEFELERPEEIAQLSKPAVHRLSFAPKLPSAEELSTARNFRYRSFGDDVRLTIEGGTAWVHFPGPPSPEYPLALHVIDFLKTKRTLWRRVKAAVFGGPFGLPLALLPLVAGGLLDKKIDVLPGSQRLAVFAGSVLFSVGVLLLWMKHSLGASKKRPALILKARVEESSFFEQHKDNLLKLLIGIIGSVIGAAIKAAFEHK